MLIAGRTAPGHSWLNPAERIMSVLNLALQNVALMRDECQPAEIETTLKGANTMAEIRKKAERVNGLEDSWLQSVYPIIELLEARTERLSLKNKQFICQSASLDEEVKQFEEQVAALVDNSIIPGQYQDKHMKSKADYQLFLSRHCRQRQYLFQVKKCDDENCCPQRRSETDFPFVPDPQLKPGDNQHYDSFENLVGRPTTEADRPSANNVRASVVAENLQGIRNAGLVGQNVRATVTCFECGKPRCIYSKRKLSTRELRALNRIMEKYDYSCGAMIVPEGDTLEGTVSVRLQIDCSSPIEFPYYAGNNPVAVRKDVCCHCGEAGAERDQALMTLYITVLPVCHRCKQTKDIPKRTPIK